MAGALAGYLGDILVVSTPSISIGSSGNTFTDSGDHQTYTITSASKRYLDRTSSFTVQTSPDGITWTTVSASTYTLRYINAQIVFNTPNASGTQVRLGNASGNYYVYASIGQTTDWQAQLSRDFKDITAHKGVGGSPWKDFLPILRGGSFTLKKWYIDPTLQNHLSAADALIISCVTPSSNRVEGYCFVKDSNVKAAVNDVSDESLNFQIDGAAVFV